MVARTYYRLEPEPEVVDPCDAHGCTDRLHGYTLADLDSVARVAVATAFAQAADAEERFQDAWLAVAEELAAYDGHPSRGHLVWAGQQGVNRSVADRRRHLGLRTDGAAEGGNSAAFERYWWASRVQPGHATAVEERAAVRQIMGTLHPAERRALYALALTEDYAEAAALCGVKYHSFHTNLSRARRKFLALWHEGEAPSKPWGRDRRKWRQDVHGVADHRPVMVRRRASWRRQTKAATSPPP